MSNPIDTMTRTFAAAGVDLGEAMLAQLAQTSQGLHAKVVEAVQQGSRLVVGLEFEGGSCTVRLLTIDDYQRVKRVMSIGADGEAPSQQEDA